MPLLKKRVAVGSTVCSDTFRSYTGVAAKGYVHRLVEHDQQEYVDAQGNHINGLEGFWGYLKRKLAAKGGLGENGFHYTLLNMSGVIIIET
jgi:transposase